MRIKLRLGIGDLIMSKAFLGNEDQVFWSLDYGLLGYRGPCYKEFITEVSKLIFHEDRFVFMDEIDVPSIGWINLATPDSRPVPVDLSGSLPSG